MALEGGALSTAEFAEFGKQVVLFAHITSRVDDEPYPNLLQEKGGMGFPHIAMLDAEGDVLTIHQSSRSVEGFQESLDKSSEVLALQMKADAGDANAKVEVFLMQLDMMSFEDAKAKLSEVKALPAFAQQVDSDRMAEIEQTLVNLEVNDIISGVRSEEDQEAAAEKLIALKSAGRTPTGQTAMMFWNTLLNHAATKRDVKMIREFADGWIATLDPDDSRESRMIEGISAAVERVIGEIEEGGEDK